MIIAIIILFYLGSAQGVLWWQLPNFYLESNISTLTLEDALYYAVRHDRRFLPPNVTRFVEECNRPEWVAMDGLDAEQIRAIKCYTLGNKMSYFINTALQFLDEELITAWTPFLKFFHTGVENMISGYSKVILCRGDGFYYGNHAFGSIVRLPLSYSLNEVTSDNTGVCEIYAGQSAVVPEPNYTCTITRLLLPGSANSIASYSTKLGELEFIMLPGTLAEVVEIIPQQPQACRRVTIREISRRKVSKSRDIKHLFNDYQLSTQMEQYDRFLRDYYKPSFLVSVAKTQLWDIQISGGSDDPYNFWPYITHVTYGKNGTKSKLSNGQILVRVNEYATRGLLQKDVEALIQSAKVDPQVYTNFTVATR